MFWAACAVLVKLVKSINADRRSVPSHQDVMPRCISHEPEDATESATLLWHVNLICFPALLCKALLACQILGRSCVLVNFQASVSVSARRSLRFTDTVNAALARCNRQAQLFLNSTHLGLLESLSLSEDVSVWLTVVSQFRPNSKHPIQAVHSTRIICPMTGWLRRVVELRSSRFTSFCNTASVQFQWPQSMLLRHIEIAGMVAHSGRTPAARTIEHISA